ncbi:hypothetical protein BSKO_mt0068 (mitochondrion) [Bryopsis sp. KO-2023]|nr:hypothetical protein BSKO_mt0068 [Bryopsis sp. KO-2023]
MTIFPNHLDRRNAAAILGTALVLDLFHLHTVHRKKKGHAFQILLVVDLASAEIVAQRVFLTTQKRGEVPARKVIDVLKNALTSTSKEVILHTDRGVQFTSNEWVLFVQSIGATPSMSDVARPNDNAVAERTLRTIKNQLFDCPTSFPKSAAALQQLQTVLDERVTFYNQDFRPQRACGQTPQQHRNSLLLAEPLAPQRILARPNNDHNHLMIQQFKRKAVQMREDPFQIIQHTRDGVARIEESSRQLQQALDKRLANIEMMLGNAQREKKVQQARAKRVPLRDPADNTIYNWLMQQHKAPGQWRSSFFRFRLAITILRFTGIRAAEVAAISKEQVEGAIRHGHLDIELAKTRKQHRYVLTQAARDALEKLSMERIEVFAKHSKLAGNMQNNNWVTFLNQHLLPAVKHFKLNLKSHSFRVGYITHLLKHAPVQHAATTVGHVDIRSTLAYNRFVPNRKTILELLERDHDHANKTKPMDKPQANTETDPGRT